MNFATSLTIAPNPRNLRTPCMLIMCFHSARWWNSLSVSRLSISMPFFSSHFALKKEKNLNGKSINQHLQPAAGKTFFRKNASKWRSRKKEKSICIFSNLFRNIKASKSILIARPWSRAFRAWQSNAFSAKMSKRRLSNVCSRFSRDEKLALIKLQTPL